MENGESRRPDQRDSGRDETEEERLDRNLGELLQELRVALPGVQVLFAFLLAVPFQQGFQEVTEFQKDVYFATLILASLSATMLISPSAYHRVTFRYQQKRRLVYYSNRFAIVGLALLALAMTGAILLISDVLFSTAAALVTAGIALCVFGFFWFVLPLQRRLRLAAGQEPLGKPEGE